ncbi:MAG: Protein translocase subunit SecA, partial [Candidatus Wolfebacteria bacterium GW2011_GWC1_37_10]
FENWLKENKEKLETAQNIKINQRQPTQREPVFKNVGRNDPCPCGSKKKFKKCHGA